MIKNKDIIDYINDTYDVNHKEIDELVSQDVRVQSGY